MAVFKINQSVAMAQVKQIVRAGIGMDKNQERPGQGHSVSYYLDFSSQSAVGWNSQLVQLQLDLFHPRSEFVYLISEGPMTRESCGEHRSKHPGFACGHGMPGS